MIDSGDVPPPQIWNQYITCDDNKADIALYLSNFIVEHSAKIPAGCEIVVGGGFADELLTVSNTRHHIPELQNNHEEADTRLILHSLDSVNVGFKRLLVHCRDTDVLLLLIHFFGRIPVEVWMCAGTAKQRKYYPVHEIVKKIHHDVIDNILGFHAITGSDTTSSFLGYGKKSGWKIF